jgi:hypothetical protein
VGILIYIFVILHPLTPTDDGPCPGGLGDKADGRVAFSSTDPKELRATLCVPSRGRAELEVKARRSYAMDKYKGFD